MRHGDKIKNLGRTKAHRDALMRNMTISLIANKRIITTLTKAKSLRVYAEPLITRSKDDSTHNRRVVFSYLQDKEALKELFGTISDKVADRPGGYTRIIKMPRRLGDAADMALIELVDFNELYSNAAAETTKKTRRSRRGAGTGTATKATPSATEASAENTAAAAETAATEDMGAEETTDTIVPANENMPEAPEAPAQEEGSNEEKA